MRLLDTLRRDHEAIEAVALAFATFADRHRAGAASAPAPVEDGEAFVRFFRLFAGRFHHGREEDTLFPALIIRTEATAESGPVFSLLGQHRELEGLLGGCAAALGVDPQRAADCAIAYAGLLVRHIDAENSVLFAECEYRFRRMSILELDDREPDAEECAARDAGLALLASYPAAALPDILRGEGCVCCPSYGVTCDGVEREWSTDHEWDDMIDRPG